MLNGGGTQIQIIDAAANGVPIVSTRMGTEELEFSEGQSIVLADTDEAFASACIELLRSDTRCQSLRAGAADAMRMRYDIKHVEDRLKTIFETGTDRARAS